MSGPPSPRATTRSPHPCCRTRAIWYLNRLVVVGGVSANRLLRQQMDAACAARRARVHYPEPRLCTDNGAMIAAAAALRWQAGLARPQRRYAFDVKPRWPLEQISQGSPAC